MNTAKPALLYIFTFAILIISTSWMRYPKEIKQHFNCAAPIKAQESESE